MRDQKAPMEPPTAEIVSFSPAHAVEAPPLLRYAGVLRSAGLFVGQQAARLSARAARALVADLRDSLGAAGEVAA